MTRGVRLRFGRLATWMDRVGSAIPRRLQIPPLRSFGTPVGMTRGVRLRFGRLATWMDRVGNGYSAKTADPSTALLSELRSG